MKKLLFISAMLLSFCYLPAQTNILQKEKDNITHDIVSLQKSNAGLKNQLNEQKQILIKEIVKTDSIFSLLHSTNSEIRKSTDHQSSIAAKIANLEDQTSEMSMSLHKRKFYVIFGLAASLIFVVVYLLYMRAKLSTLKLEMNQKEKDLHVKISQTETAVSKGIDEMKTMFSEQQKEINNTLEKQKLENNNKFVQLSSDVTKNITIIEDEMNNTMENERKSVKEIIQEHRTQSEKDFDQKIAEVNNNIQTKIELLKKEIEQKLNNSKS